MTEEQTQADSAPGQLPGQQPDSADSTKRPGTSTAPDSADSTNDPDPPTDPVDPGCTVSDDQQRFAALKNYVRVDFDDDDPLLSMLLAVADDYLTAAGIDRELAPAPYDLAAFHMVLTLYDGRETDAVHAAATPAVRQIINQLKIRCAIAAETTPLTDQPTNDDPTDGEVVPDGSSSPSGTALQPDNNLRANRSH